MGSENCRRCRGVRAKNFPRRTGERQHTHHHPECPEVLRLALSGSLIIPPLPCTPAEPICLCISEKTSGEVAIAWYQVSHQERAALGAALKQLIPPKASVSIPNGAPPDSY